MKKIRGLTFQSPYQLNQMRSDAYQNSFLIVVVMRIELIQCVYLRAFSIPSAPLTYDLHFLRYNAQ
mgnify:FL=1|jgi:hypothetical protein